MYIGVPAEQTGERTSIVWQTYRDARAKWQREGEFAKRFPSEPTYRHSLPEESEALSAAARVLETIQDESEKKDAKLISGDPALRLLLDLHRAHLIEPYVLFSLGNAGIGRDYAAYRARRRDSLEEYLNKFVVPAVH